MVNVGQYTIHGSCDLYIHYCNQLCIPILILNKIPLPEWGNSNNQTLMVHVTASHLSSKKRRKCKIPTEGSLIRKDMATTYQLLQRAANLTLRDGELTPFRNHLTPLWRCRYLINTVFSLRKCTRTKNNEPIHLYTQILQTSIQNCDPHNGPIQKTEHLTTYNQGMDSSSYIWGGQKRLPVAIATPSKTSRVKFSSAEPLCLSRHSSTAKDRAKGGSEADGEFPSNGQKSKG